MKNKGNSIDEYYKNIPIVNFPKNLPIIILKIHNTIFERPTIKQCIKIEWKIKDEKAKMCEILFGVSRGLIKDIFVLDYIKKSKSVKYRKELYVTRITDIKLRNKYVNKLIPYSYRVKGQRSPIRYNFKIEKGVIIYY